LISGILTVLLVTVLLSNIDFSEFKSVFSNLSYYVVFIGFLLYTLIYVFRSFRLGYVLEKKFKFKELFRVISLHNLFSQVLPFRSGELSLVYLLKKKGVDSSKSISSLIFLRIFDFLSIFFLLIFSLLFAKSAYFLLVGNFFWLFLLSFFIFSLFVVFLFKPAKFFGGIINLILFFKLNKYKFFCKGLSYLEKVSDSFSSQKRNLFFVFLLSLLVWISSFVFTYYILNGLGLEISYSYFIFAMSLILIFSSLPIHGILNFGTQETFWTVVFLAIGVDKIMAISSGFIVHGLVVIYFLFWGIASYFIK